MLGTLAVALVLTLAVAVAISSSTGENKPPSRISAADRQIDEGQAIAMLRQQLHRRGFDASVTGGPMQGVPPGAASAADFDGDGDMGVPIGQVQSAAWLVWTDAGRWWVWEYGAAAPADRRAARLQGQIGQ